MTMFLFGSLSWFFFAILAYVYFSYSLMVIAKKIDAPDGWMAWVPILNIFLLVKASGKPGWWFILFFIPLVNIAISVIVIMEIAKKLKKPEWVGILVLIPIISFFVPAILTFPTDGKDKTQTPVPLILAIVCSLLLLISFSLTGISMYKQFALMNNSPYKSGKPSYKTGLNKQKLGSSSITNVPTVIKKAQKSNSQAFNAWKNQGINYWNCTYWYSLYYPSDWNNNGMTLDSKNVELYGNGLTVSINNFSIFNYLDLDSFAENRKNLIQGKVVDSRDKIRNKNRMIAYEFANPSSSVVFWESSDGYIETRIFGSDYDNQIKTISFFLAALNTNPQSLECSNSYYYDQNIEEDWGGDVPYCDYENDPDCWPEGEFPNQGNTDQGCSFPNGDIEYWWTDVSQDVRDCYINEYGDPGLAQ